MARLIYTPVIGLLYALAVMADTTGISGAARPEFRECQIGAADAAQRLQARCATLTVPEDRAHPAAKQISLHVAVLKARASTPKPDALFFIAGGPGQASTEAFLEESVAFERIRGERDIVLVDQRGTGESNRLDCPALPQGALPSDAEIATAAQACLKQLPGDPRFYTTSVAVQDLEDVRKTLGYRQVDLYGISYGTRVALQYLRAYPNSVRTVILDGVVPADRTLGPDVSLDAQRALSLIFARCGEDAACHKAFPDLTDTFTALQKDLGSRTVSVTLRDPFTGAPRTDELNWDQVAGTVRLMSYQSETASLLPLLIHQAAAQHDYLPLMSAALLYKDQLDESFATGMSAAVLCTEDAPFISADPQQEQRLHVTYLGASTMDVLLKSCKVWPRGVMDPDFKEAVVSAKPVLLLSGEDDPITPPADAEHAAKTLSASLSLVTPGQGHGNVFRGCIPRIATAFVDAGTVKGLDTSCVKEMKPFPFFVNFSGPKP